MCGGGQDWERSPRYGGSTLEMGKRQEMKPFYEAKAHSNSFCSGRGKKMDSFSV